MKAQEFFQLVQGGAQPVVRFGEEPAEQETCISRNWLGRCVRAKPSPYDEESYEFIFELDEFLANNKPLAESNYYDKNGDPTLTCFQAGFYRAEEKIYVGMVDEIEPFFTPIDEAGGELLARYVREQQEIPEEHRTSYVHWLEALVRKLEGAAS